MRHERETDIWARPGKDTALTTTTTKSPPTAVTIAGVQRRFGRFPALNDVSLDIAPGELLALLGPSGSGKTTLLRLIAGLDAPDKGVIAFDGEDVTALRAAERRVGFVFQQYALFKHMTVARNVAFGLEVKPRRERAKRSERNARVEALLELVELKGLGARHPSQLSGGQRQRVALARALAVAPKILLLDEPFGALDATVRKTLRRELRRIHDATGLTTVFVTHDQEEALELADRVALLNHGRIAQIGAPQEVIDHPASPFVAGFVGQANRLEGEVRAGVFHTGGAVFPVIDQPDGRAVAFARPDEIALASVVEPALDATLTRITPRSGAMLLECVAKTGEILEVAVARAEAAVAGAPGRPIRLAIRGARVFPLVSGGDPT